jgi:hypothetical protein
MDRSAPRDGVPNAAGSGVGQSVPDNPGPSDDAAGFDQWAIVDVMGHQRYIGRVSEQVIAGKGFVRVDVPASDGESGFTKLIGPDAIHSISPISEQLAREMCGRRRQYPIESYALPKVKRLPAGTETLIDDEEDYDVDDYV